MDLGVLFKLDRHHIHVAISSDAFSCRGVRARTNLVKPPLSTFCTLSLVFPPGFSPCHQSAFLGRMVILLTSSDIPIRLPDWLPIVRLRGCAPRQKEN